MDFVTKNRRALAVCTLALAALVGAGSSLLGTCGPFTDVAADSFCPLVLEIFTLGITTGTTPTTYDPTGNVTRLQMAAFLSRTVDGVLSRGSRRAALRRFATTQNAANLGVTTLPSIPFYPESDGADVWVSMGTSRVSRVRASDGKVLETWTGAGGAYAVLSAMGKVFVSADAAPGQLYQIDPRLAAGAVTTLASNLGDQPLAIVHDGARLWTANFGNGTPGSGSVSIVTPGATIPWTVTNVLLGFSEPQGAVFDGSSVWVTDYNLNTLFRLSSSGAILQTVTVQSNPAFPVFDGANIWVPNSGSNSISIVRASNGTVLRTLTGNGMNGPWAAAFDGQRVLVTNATVDVDSVSIWKAADSSEAGNFLLGSGSHPFGACSDGVFFWIVLQGKSQIARF